MPRLKTLLTALPPEFTLTLADVGSAGGLKDRWLPAASRVRALLFEPRDVDAVTASGREVSFPVALAESAGTRELRITAMANMSSLLEPNARLLGSFRKKGAHAKVERRVSVQVQPLDALLAREGQIVDALKIDTQGSELQILQGAAGALADSVVLAEVEVSFIERYLGQALAADLITWMQARGFRLIELYRLKRYRVLNSLGVANVGTGAGHRAGQLAYGDAVFMAGDELLERRWSALSPEVVRHQLLALLVSLLVYGKVDIAAATFERHRQLLPEKLRNALGDWLPRWRRTQYGRGALHLLMDYLARKV
jgi:FkbM family methyltransferase